MKWYLSALIGALVLVPSAGWAQRMEVLEIGKIGAVEDRAPTTWAMSGMNMIHISRMDGEFTPIMRSLRMDARTVGILCRTQAPPLNASDVRTHTQDGRQYVTVRGFLLAEVHPGDARAEGTTVELLAERWAHAVGYALPRVAPMPNRFGV